MSEPYIASRQNEQIKNLVKLRERKHRDRQARFLVEGLRELGHAIGSEHEIEQIYYCPEFFTDGGHENFISETRSAHPEIELVRTSESAFSKASGREGPDGLIGLGLQRSHAADSLKLPADPLILALEGIEKPGNLGAILRSADGAGADAVVLVDCVVDPYNPNAIRSSQGLIFALPVVSMSREGFKVWLEGNKIQCIATTPDEATDVWDLDLGGRIALLLGAENAGLSDYWIENADRRLAIPMAGRADSLNVAATAAICLYEARRQRRNGKTP